MSVSAHFSLPYSGMKDGYHKYVFEADDSFFAEFENSPIEKGKFQIAVEVDKRQGLSDMTIHVDGHVSAICDRCLAAINLPITGVYNLLLKVKNEGDPYDDEVIYLREDEPSLYLGQVIYEFICLSLPLINRYDCESEKPSPCNDAVLKKLNEAANTNTISVDENVWKALKGLDTEN